MSFLEFGFNLKFLFFLLDYLFIFFNYFKLCCYLQLILYLFHSFYDNYRLLPLFYKLFLLSKIFLIFLYNNRASLSIKICLVLFYNVINNVNVSVSIFILVHSSLVPTLIFILIYLLFIYYTG